MRFGMFDQIEQPGGMDAGRLMESRLTLAERAEEAGFWGYHKSEHHMTPLDHAPGIGLFLAALAQRTSTMRLCSLVHILPFHHPLRLVEEVCLLDHLSGGRFEFGFGKGISAPEHSLWGLDPAEAAARTEETLAIVLAAMQCDGTLSFDGEFFRFDDVPIEVRPRQRPYPPLWRPGTLDIAAAMGVSTVVGGPTALAHEAIARYRDRRQDGVSGGHPATVGVVRKFIVAPTDAEADALGRRAWVRYTHDLGLLFRAHGVAIPNDPTIGGDYDRAKQVEAIVVGSPDRVREHCEHLASSPLVEYLIGCFAFGDLSHDEALRSLELFAEHVMG